QCLDRLLRRLGLRFTEPFGGVDDLALEIRRVHDVVVDDADRPDARRSQVERGWRAETTGPDQQHPRVEQPDLALLADLWNQQVPAVAGPLVGIERAWQNGRKAVPFPVRVAAGEGVDVLVAELGERLRGERGARAARAVDDDRSLAVRK